MFFKEKILAGRDLWRAAKDQSDLNFPVFHGPVESHIKTQKMAAFARRIWLPQPSRDIN